jgi:hypothetical protein
MAKGLSCRPKRGVSWSVLYRFYVGLWWLPQMLKVQLTVTEVPHWLVTSVPEFPALG